MKKILLSIALLLGVAFGAEAQTKAGNFIAGGSLGFTSSTVTIKSGDKSVKLPATNTLTLTPSFSYFLIDNLAVGADLALIYSSEKTENVSGSTTAVTLMPHVAYYFDLNETIKPYAKVRLGVANETVKGNDQSVSKTGFAWGAGVGVATFLTSNVALNTEFGYNSSIFKSSNEILGKKVETTTIPGSFALSVGLSVFF